MLILAGVVLVLAFLVSAFAVNEISSQEQRLRQGGQTALPKVYAEVRDKVAGTLGGLVYAGMDNGTLRAEFNATRDDAARLAERHAAQIVLRLADGNDTVASKSEGRSFKAMNSSWGWYGGVWSYNGSRDYSDVRYDLGDDGIVFDMGRGEITGVIAYLMMADSTSRLEDTFVAAVN
jgi:hypothetical protein